MKIKQISTAVTLILTMTLTILTILPVVFADTDIDTYAYCVVAPNPVGVGQPVTVSMWIDKLPPLGQQNQGLYYVNSFALDITKPDGTTSTMGPMDSDWIGSQHISYTPSDVGTYYFQFRYLGEVLESRRASGQPFANDTYLPSTSAKISLVVQEDQIPSWPAAPLPTEYWQRPIEGQNREWHVLGGAWLSAPLQFGSGYNATGAFNPYTTAPNSAHIMWTKPHIFGGIAGGADATDFYTGLSYEEHWNPPSVVAMFGRLYYHLPMNNRGTAGGLACVDIRTGETIWVQEDTVIDIGQLLNYNSPNQHGIIPYLWDYGSTWIMYDAITGREYLRMVNATSPTKLTWDENGNILSYRVASSYIRLWNSSKVEGLERIASGISTQWRPPLGGELDWRTGIEWEVSIPNLPGRSTVLLDNDIIICTKDFLTVDPPVAQVEGFDAHTGALRWAFNITDFPMIQRDNYNFGPIHNGAFTWFNQATMQWYGYDAYTGKLLWGPSEPYESAWGVYSQSYRGSGQPFSQVAYGNLYATSYDGTVHAYNMRTGENIFNAYTGSSGLETQYGNYPMYGGVTIADGKLYITSNEHSPNSPNWRGGKLYCIDAFDGTILWSVYSWMPGPIIADGYLVGLNSYDGQIYSFGKGPSAVTVSAPDVATTMGTPIVIKGTVTDVSPGTETYTQSARFPNGVPAMSDESQSAWMEYVYMQKPIPTDATGVEVWIDVLDSNGNYRNIGTTTSDISGFFSFEWEPDIPGKYTVVATFAGSESYWPSYSETAFTVVEPVVTPAPTPTPAPMTDTYVTAFGSGIIIAIVIGFALLLLRKR